MPFLTYDPLPQCLQHSSATRFLLALDHDRGCTRYLLEVKCLPSRAWHSGRGPRAGSLASTADRQDTTVPGQATRRSGRGLRWLVPAVAVPCPAVAVPCPAVAVPCPAVAVPWLLAGCLGPRLATV